MDLTSEQKTARSGFRAFVAEHVSPVADRADREQILPEGMIGRLSEAGLMGAVLSAEVGGRAFDAVTHGLLHEELGRGCSSLRSILTVHEMVALAISRWGSAEQREAYLARMSRGEVLGAFALSEPEAGSDARSIRATAVESDDGYRLTGRKQWITAGRIADLFLVFARVGEKPSAFLVEGDAPGLSIEPISNMLGLRAAMLARIDLDDCAADLLGAPGAGLSHVAGTALDLGRYTVACGCVGIGQACLDACLSYVTEREQFGRRLREHQLIQEMVAEMIVQVDAARLMCRRAASRRDAADPRSIMDTSVSKYFASRMALRVASDAVQIHGARGCSAAYPVARHFRDAKIMEIIEGSSQIQQLLIAHQGIAAHRRSAP